MTSTYNIVLNSSNVIGQGNNTFQYNFIKGAIDLPEDSEIAINTVSIPYAFPNINSTYGFTSFQYYISNSSNVQTAYTVDLSSNGNGSFLTVSDLNKALQATMKSKGHYYYATTQTSISGGFSTTTFTMATPSTFNLPIGTILSGYNILTCKITAQTGKYAYTVDVSQTVTDTMLYADYGNITNTFYPLSITTDSTSYSYVINSTQIIKKDNVAGALGLSWHYADGNSGTVSWTGGYPTDGTTRPYIVIPTTSPNPSIGYYTLGNLLGFQGGNYPSINTGLSVTTLVSTTSVSSNGLSNSPPFAPQGSFINNIILRCNLVSNDSTFPTDIIDVININSQYGSNINYMPQRDLWLKCKSGRHSNVTITLCDQKFNVIQSLDPNITISLLIRYPKK